ncbi:MAG: hypothetical protein CHACPFDD_01656 [Phycisphaerae bacterium]|nr:hypothetical protein [Phycisphaerae bacterium]
MHDSQPTNVTPSTPLTIRAGRCYVHYAHDVAAAIDLDHVDRIITADKQRETIRHQRRAPQWVHSGQQPLRIVTAAEPVRVGACPSAETVEIAIYEFGAISVTFEFALSPQLDNLLALSEALYDHALLRRQARRCAEELLATIGPAMDRAGFADAVEDYFVFQLDEISPERPARTLIEQHADTFARILRCDSSRLSDDEQQDALACRVSYSPTDAAVIDWSGALLIGRDMEDVRRVLEFANVELLELRWLDQQLDRALDEAYRTLMARGRRLSVRRDLADLRRLSRLQADGALLFEGVNNSLKLLGDQYLARVYRLASQRFHLPDWDATIIRKLETLDSIYGKFSDQASALRMEVLEWIIILLIAASILISLSPGFGH